MAVEGMNDMVEGMQCIDHPYRSNNSGGGICASCLQEKLGKLVSSSFPLPLLRSSSDSGETSPIRSKPPAINTAGDSSSSKSAVAATNDVPFLLGIVKKKKNQKVAKGSSSSSNSSAENVVFKRSKSTASANHRRGFWSFLHLSSSSSSSFSSSESKASSKSMAARARVSKPEISVSEEVDDVAASFDRKVSRSRSVGCGSRSFSGDFFERISTGFGDCTLRRVESQRESHARGMKERVRCGGIFGGFILTSSSSSASSEWDVKNGPLTNGRAKSWGWAFASPIRAFAKPIGPTNGKRDIIRQASEKSVTPNLTAIPSLLSARG